MTSEERRYRHFSEAFKKEKVSLYEQKKVTVIELSRVYEVTRNTVYQYQLQGRLITTDQE